MGTFDHQGSLGRLPLPDSVDSTLATFLETVEPLLSKDELEDTRRRAMDFAKSEGPELHKLLRARANDVATRKGPTVVMNHNHPDGSAYPHTSWVEHMWETYAYLMDRMPLTANINCFQSHFKATPCSAPLQRTAWLIKGSLDGKRMLSQGLVPPETAGKTVFCSAQYHRIFSTTRVPGEQCDQLMTYPNSRHIAVERRGHWYCIPEADSLSVAQLARCIVMIKEDADKRPHGPEVAALTGCDRTVWAKARERLLNVKGTSKGIDNGGVASINYRSLNQIESAVFHVILHEASPQTPDELHEIGQVGAVGGGSCIWFDKSGSHIVCENGCAISNLEHSSADAVVPARLYVYADEFVQKNAPPGIGYADAAAGKAILGVTGIPITSYAEPAGGNSEPALAPWRLDFHLDNELKNAVTEAKATIRAIAHDNIVTCMEQKEFGAKTIAKECKGISVDSFMQMSLALAYYRDSKGELPVTYETASMRTFFHGRTECIRPQSMAQKRFLQAFDTKSIPEPEIANLIRAAGNAHRDYTRKAMIGQGWDRHLMGLRIIAMENGRAMHPFFSSPGYQKSGSFNLSTSQMPWAVQDWPGFGAYDPNAYGVCYRFTGVDTVVATVTSRRTTNGGKKDAKRFSQGIVNAMRDVRKVLAHNPPTQESNL